MTPEAIRTHIPGYVHAVIDVLEAAGKKAYPVGGCIRDLLRGVIPHDFDLTTNATPAQMKEILSGFRLIPTGAAHGTMTVISDGVPLEITTHRTDGGYTDGRHPDAVSFTDDLIEDLKRRDFTVNAMAWDKKAGVIDPFGGQNDLKRGVIRAVGNPETRFSEDALRILRCFRFSAQLDFTIEKGTLEGAKATATGLCAISVERILGELTRLLTAPAAARGLTAMADAECVKYVFFNTVPDFSFIDSLKKLPPDAAVRLAALLQNEAPDTAEALCRRLHASNAFTDTVIACIRAANTPLPLTPYEARRFVCTHFPYFEKGLALQALRDEEGAEKAAKLCRQVLRDRTAVEIRRLAVGGKELQSALHVRPAMTGTLLSLLQDFVWQNPKNNAKGTLLKKAAEMCAADSAFCEKEDDLP